MKLRIILTSLLLTGIMSINSFAAGINVFYNNEQVVFPDAQPKIINDRTMVPIRGLFEKLGYDVSWDSVSGVATLRGNRVVISANEEILMANIPGGQFIELDKSTMPVISDGRLYLPLRVIAQTTGCLVNWDANTKSVIIAQRVVEKNNDEDTEYGDEGTMRSEEQEYLTTLFSYLDDIKSELITSRDPSLMKFYNVNNTVIAEHTGKDYSSIITAANNIKALTANESLEDVKTSSDLFADLIINICTAAADNSISNADLDTKIENASTQRESISINFGISLVDYFNKKNVAYEKLFTEYCLDLMKY